jgi:DTW domain-containing protein YfiP
MCWCDALRPFTIGFELALLMHPKEARVAIGTGRLVHRAVTGSHLLINERFDDDPRLAALLARDLSPVIVFPRADAHDLDVGPPVFDKPPLVLFIDGTWSTAKKLLRLAPKLAALPAIRFSPSSVSRYGRLRKEPRAEYTSTLESVHHVIDRFDALGLAPVDPSGSGGRPHDHLLRLMEEVVARQLAFEPDTGAPAARGTARSTA